MAFLTPHEAFLLATKGRPQLTAESFLDDLRSQIAESKVHASGLRFFHHRARLYAVPVEGSVLRTDVMTISPKTVVSERTQIPPLAMVDYNGPDIDGQITRLAADGLSVEGWENVQLSRKDIEREWPRPPAAAPTDKSQQPQAAATPKTKRKKPPGPSPKTRLLVEAAMEAKYTLKQLTNMTEFELENEFKHLASRSTILRAKESLLSKRRRSKL